MARPKNSADEKSLTETELQVMKVLWRIGRSSVHKVQQELSASQDKEYAYTTTSTFLRVLEKKGFVGSEKEGRGHSYFTLIVEEDYQRKATDDLVKNVFSGKPSVLIKNLLGNAEISLQELEEVKKLLKEKSENE